MLKKSRTVSLIIISIYILTLLCGVGVFISNTILDNIRVYISIFLPILIIVSSFIDVKKKLLPYKKDKFQIILTTISLIWIIITIFFGIKIGVQNIKGFIHFFNVLLLLLIISSIEINNNDRYRIKKAIFISSFLCVVIGIIQYIFNLNLNTFENAKYPGILGRINSTFYIATLADKYFVIIAAILSYELLNSKNKFLTLHFILTSVAINLTFSRSGILSFCFILVVFFIFSLIRKKYRNNLLVIIIVIIMFSIPGTNHLFQHSANYIYEKLKIPEFLQINFIRESNVTDNETEIGNNNKNEKDVKNKKNSEQMTEIEKDSSLMFRTYYNEVGKELFKENIFTGIGIGNYSYLYNMQNASSYLKKTDVLEKNVSYMYPHNGYIYLGSETGIIGLILINSCIIYITYKCISKNKFKTVYLPLILLVTFFLCSYTEGLLYNKQYIYIFILLYSFYTNHNIYSKKNYNRQKNNKKKIKFLCLHLGYGGIESATINTANSLCNKYDITITSVYNLKNNISSTINKKIQIKYLIDLEPNKEKFMEALKNKKLFCVIKEGLKSIKILYLKKSKMIKEIINDDSDIIISTRMEFSKLLSRYGSNKSLKIACEHQHHNNNNKYINTIKYEYINIDVLVALTNSLASDYKKFIKKSSTKVVVIPNMLNNDKVSISKLNNNKIISVGRLHPGKCIKEAIDVFIDCNTNYQFEIVGDGEQYNELNCYIKEQKQEKKIKLVGRKNSNQINELLFKSDIFIMTSISEGLPMVLLEAMRCGVPAIAYETDSGVTDIIDDGVNGFVIKNRNHEEMVKKLNILMNNKEMLFKMSRNALLKSRLYSSKNIERKWIKLFEEINNE